MFDVAKTQNKCTTRNIFDSQDSWLVDKLPSENAPACDIVR